MSSPYQPPESPLPSPPRKARPSSPLARRIAIIASLICVASTIVMFVVTAMSFSDMLDKVVAAETIDEEISRQIFSETYGKNRRFIEFCSVVGLAAYLAVFLVAMSLSYRARWFFWVAMLGSLFYLMAVPIGTVMALVLLVFLIIRRREFRPVTSVET